MLDHPKTARILVREEISSAALRRLAPASVRDKMEICPDMAFLLEPDTARAADPRISRLPRPRLALTVREWDFPEAGTREEKRHARDGYLQAVRAAALHVVLKRRGSVVLVPHTRGPGAFEDDRIVSRRLWDRLAKDLPPDRKVFLDLPDETAPEDLLSLYAGMDVVLATRTHSAIFALLAGTPAVSVHYQPKGRGIMAMLGLAGRSLSIAGLGEAALIEALDAALDDDGESRRRVAARIAILREEISACLRTALKRAL
jgi:colanic acid/amylovoran biosynthesis protein